MDGCSCKICQINTHWKLLALSSGLANFTRGTTFSRLLLCHQVHVQYCAFTLSATTKKKHVMHTDLDSVSYNNWSYSALIYGNVKLTFQTWVHIRHCIFPGYVRLCLCIQ